MKIVAVAGGFDPVHDGHLSHFTEAAKLGDLLVIITHPDIIMIHKKGFCYHTLERRIEDLHKIEVGKRKIIVVSIDNDGTVTRTLEAIRPDIFAKGGDRNPCDVPLPYGEVRMCEKIGCEIRYNVGAPKRPEWSSTKIALENGKIPPS